MLQVFLNRKDIHFIFMQMQILYQIREYHKDFLKKKYQIVYCLLILIYK